jgi:hypothetical protein
LHDYEIRSKRKENTGVGFNKEVTEQEHIILQLRETCLVFLC